MESSEFEKRRTAVEEFNAKSRFRKRGIAALPTKFGIAFTALMLNQVGAVFALSFSLTPAASFPWFLLSLVVLLKRNSVRFTL